MSKSYIYLDYAAATPLDERVLQAMWPYFSRKFYNPSATYWPAHEVAEDLEAARAKVAHWLGARPSEIIFTAGGTEANNLTIHGIMRQFSEGNIVVSSIEHESVLAPAHHYDCREIAVKPDGTVDLESLQKAIDDQTVLVSVMYANNEIGTIEPIRETSKLIAKVREARRSQNHKLPLYFHTDAAQAANYLDLHVARLGVDLMTINGGKIYGPKQSGVLFVGAHVPLKSIIEGGGQENNIRSGTENVPQSIGFAKALTFAQEMREAETKRLQELQQHFYELLEKRLPQAIINGSKKKRLPNNIHITIPGQDNERLLIQLDEAGILAAAGSACSASDEEPSHVLRATGLTDKEAQASLRFTMGRSTTKEQIEQTVATLAKLLP
jgi:cysteine desulfurase